MEFIKILDALKEEYKDDMAYKGKGALYLHPGGDFWARHKFYTRLTEKEFQEKLIDQYIGVIPEQFLELMRYTNGLSIYRPVIEYPKYKFTGGGLTVYGVRRTDEGYEDEPWDIQWMDSIDDDTHSKWLKIGSYAYATVEKTYEYKIYVDTESCKVYVVDIYDHTKMMKWNSIDECFCDLAKELRNVPYHIIREE